MTFTSVHPGGLPKSFEELSAMHPLRPIINDDGLQAADEILDRLAVINRPTKGQAEYLHTLTLLIEDYEREIEENKQPVPALDTLKYLMEVHDLKQTDLAKLLKIGASAASMILSGQRPITADHARKLGKRFSLDPGAFL